MAGKIYAVKKGRKPGIYMSWDACKAQVMGFPTKDLRQRQKQKRS